MRYEIRISLTDKEEAQNLRDILADLVEQKVEVVYIQGADEYKKLDVRKWPMAQYMLSRMESSRIYTKEDLAIFIEEMGWAASSIPTLLVKLTAEGVLSKVGTGVYRKVSNE